jgi:hypothetical protein
MRWMGSPEGLLAGKANGTWEEGKEGLEVAGEMLDWPQDW